jgi:hypothetical protein
LARKNKTGHFSDFNRLNPAIGGTKLNRLDILAYTDYRVSVLFVRQAIDAFPADL